MTTPHEVTDECERVHCHIHHTDEPDGWLNCLECGHAWPSPRAVRRDHRRIWVRMFARRAATVAGLLRALTIRADQITACPHCSHDL
ncbi:hypothetical protein ACQEU3_47060 [Spirillospora sp. CA-253888]